ncbi:hypothetical protein L7F22_034406 [Adiantum nelumboides]|nr:hypothetical protein [Adiantum nelumboides]
MSTGLRSLRSAKMRGLRSANATEVCEAAKTQVCEVMTRGLRSLLRGLRSARSRRATSEGGVLVSSAPLYFWKQFFNKIDDNVSCEVIDTKDASAIEPIEEESINPHLNQKACKEDDKKIQVFEGCNEFLKSLLSISNVGIWSTTNDTQVMPIIKILEKEAGEQFSFFMIWGQSQQCVELRITRPDNPGVEAFFKPLAIASIKFGIDLKRMFLIDDAPLKGCVNTTLNSIFPPSFNIDQEDNILLGELLPYTKALHHVNNICTITGSSLYGQASIVQGHELYNHVQMVVTKWEEHNLVCLQKNYSTSRLPDFLCVPESENGASSSTTGMSTRRQDKKKPTLDQEKLRILKNIKSISTLKGVELIMLAQKLGYKEPVIQAYEAKSYIKQLGSHLQR